MKRLFNKKTIPFCLCLAIVNLSFTSISHSNPIADAELYSVRTKSSIRYAFSEDKGGSSNGAGFLVDRARGWILTNAHVSGRGTGDVEVSFKGEAFEDAKLVYVDPELDAAILSVDPSKIPARAKEAQLQCDKSELNGQEVAAFGHPHDLSYSASRGIVSKVRVHDGRDWVQIDAAINPGNSGGPLINLSNGKIIGINAMALKDTEGLNFAVPIIPVCKILDLLKSGKNPSPPALTINFAQNEDSEEYLIVGPAAHFEKLPSTFRIGDRITHVDGQEVKTPTELSTLLRGEKRNAAFTIKRGDETNIAELEVVPAELITERKYLLADGALIAPDYYLERYRENQFLAVHSVRKGSYADRTGWQKYTLVMAVDGTTPNSVEHLKELLSGDKRKRIMVRSWSDQDGKMYDYSEFDYWPYKLELKENGKN
jgi:serine protease Do